MADRRRFERTQVSWPVRVYADDGMVPGITEDVSPYGFRIVTARAASVRMGRSYRVDVLAGFEAPRSILGEAKHADSQGRIGFETRWRWEPRRSPAGSSEPASRSQV